MTATQAASGNAGLRKEDPSTNPPTGWILTISMVAIAVLFGIWAFTVNNSDSGVPADVIEAIDDYNDAWNNWDGDAFIEMTTDDYIMRTEKFGDWTQQNQARTVGDSITHDWRAQWIGEPTGTGDGPWYVARTEHLDSDMYPPEGIDGLSTYMVVVDDDDGQMKIARHTFQAQFME